MEDKTNEKTVQDKPENAEMPLAETGNPGGNGTPESGNIFTNKSNNPRKKNGMEMLSKFLLAVFIIILNGLFVFAAVNFFLQNKYKGGVLQNVQPVKVVEEESQTIDVAQKASPAVVSVIATAEVPKYETLYGNFFDFGFPSQVQNGTEQKQVAAGSGFIISSDGYIITNKHVVDDENAKYTVILHDDKHKDEKIEASVIARDPNQNRDIAILKIDKKDLPYLNMGDSDNLKVGQTAIAIGYALGQFDNTVSKGVISGLSRTIAASGTAGNNVENLKNLIQIDTAVNPGNSGGPLLDINGNVIGLNVAMAEAQSIGFAIPINEAKKDYEDFKANGSIQKQARAYLGVRAAAIDENLQKENNLPYNYGAIVSRGQDFSALAVIPGSPADKAGVMENDIILEVSGEKVTDKNTLQDLISKYKPGDQVKLKVYHKGEEKDIDVTLEQSKS